MEKKNPWIIQTDILLLLSVFFFWDLATLSHQETVFWTWILPLPCRQWDEEETKCPFSPCHNSPDVQRGANQGTSSVFTELDITTRQWKELCCLIEREEPMGTLTLTGTWKESLSHSVLSPSAVVTTSYRPFTHRSRSIIKVDSGFAPVTCVM